jgi:ApbE superfamily uncharacterized protein (UPF0280 family)
MKTEELHIKETHLRIIADVFSIYDVKQFVMSQRAELENFIQRDPFFQTTYEPYRCPEGAPEIVSLLCSAGERSGIGPMSAVAGTVSYLTARFILEQGASWVLVENGGDIALKINESYTLGIYAGKESPVKDLGLELKPKGKIFGVCTSSGTVGPSVSLGVSDAATVISDDVPLADSCATLLGNQVQSGTPTDEEMDAYFEPLKNIPGLEGALVIVGERVGMWGRLPSVVRTKNPQFSFG